MRQSEEELYSDRTALHYLSYMDLLPSGQFLVCINFLTLFKETYVENP